MFSQWDVYSYLKRTNGEISLAELYRKYPGENEVLEGIKEYNEMAKENPYYDEMNTRLTVGKI